MKRMIALIVLACLLRVGSAHMEAADPWLMKSDKDLIALWGRPVEDMNTIKIWKNADGLFVGAFSYISGANTLTDYIAFDAHSVCSGGTILERDTADSILAEMKTKDLSSLDQVYDIASGTTIWAKIAYDGYIVMWDGYSSTWIYDCANQREMSVFLYRLMNLF